MLLQKNSSEAEIMSRPYCEVSGGVPPSKINCALSLCVHGTDLHPANSLSTTYTNNMTTQKQTTNFPKLLAQHTSAPGSDMKWLQQLLTDLGLANWLRRMQNDGFRLSHRKTQLLEAENGQLTLRLQLEWEEDNIPL